MRQCPACGKWSLEFDEYFGRFRCFDTDCGWMALSSTECQLSVLARRTTPQVIMREKLEEIGLEIVCSFDSVNDALVFDFGLNEPAFDLPESDGRVIWRIGRSTSTVTGFSIMGARRLGLKNIRVDFDAKTQLISESLRKCPQPINVAQSSRVLVDNFEVTAAFLRPAETDVGKRVNGVLTDALQRCAEFVAR
jgi:hypothetical protein